jgi:hypothetical protein
MGPGDVWAETVKSRESTLTIRYKDGVVERYKASWNATLAVEMRDQGGSFVPYQGAVESRGCKWIITASVERTVAIPTRLGPTLPLPAMTRVLPQKALDRTTTVAENCRAASARREGEVRDATQVLQAAFDKIVQEDFDALRREAQSRSEVVEFLVE